MPMATREEQRAYQREWMARRRRDYFKDKACVWCGSTERLELDHIDPAIKVTHAVWSWSLPRRMAEIAKCQVLCYGCHKERTRQQKSKPLVHGTTTAYNGKACRCDVCRTAHAAHMRAYRARVRTSS